MRAPLKQAARAAFFCAFAALMPAAGALAATDVWINIDRGRTAGVFSPQPVFQRAILMKPDAPTDTVLLVFRGAPGYANLQSVADKFRNMPTFIRPQMRMFMQAGIALALVDCPTDQQGAPGFTPTSCLDNYRSSAQHADDVRSVMALLRAEHGIQRFYIIGHSAGTMSSRWLARHLGQEIAGSIHSASINHPGQRIWYTARDFRWQDLAAPVLHVHHADDGCPQTRHATTQDYAGNRLTTVRGGTPGGDVCSVHFHSYSGREEVASKAIIDWIKTGQVVPVVGD